MSGTFKKMRVAKGFTFVETILAIVVVGVIAGVAAKVLVAGLDVYSLIVNRNNAFQTARLAMDRMVDELVLLNPWDLRNITYMGDTRVSFIDTDRIATNFRKTTYSRPGSSIPCINRGADFLAGDVTTLDFDYYKADGTAANMFWDAFNWRRINIEFTVTAQGSAGAVHLRTDVFPRSFMYSNFE